MRILSKTGEGTSDNLRMSLSVSEDLFRVFFKTGEWNAIVRAALAAGGTYWIEKYLPLRFTNYAKAELGYAAKTARRATSPYSAKNARYKMPLVLDGNLQNTALTQSYADAKATSSNAYVTLHIATGMTQPTAKGASMPYAAQPLVNRTLSTITEREIAAIAKQAEETILTLVNGSTGTISRKKTERRALTPTQRTSIGMKQPTKRTSNARTSRELAHV